MAIRKKKLLARKIARRNKVRRMRLIAAGCGAALLILIVFLIAGRVRGTAGGNSAALSAGNAQTAAGTISQTGGAQDETQDTAQAETPDGAENTGGESGAASPDAGTSTAEQEQAEAAPAAISFLPENEPEIDFEPHATEETEPTVLMSYSEIEVDGDLLEDRSLYDPWYHIDFKTGSHYAENVDGIITFRGNSFRSDPTYGLANLKQYKISRQWTKSTGTLEYNDRVWSGNGWTGQPLMMRWPSSVKQHMNLYEDAKTDDDLVEVIYASMDGYIYFLNLHTGEATRDPMYVGWTFKGAGALDPRGYPLLYVGAGYNSDKGIARVFIISLLDCSVLYTFGNEDDFSLRGSLSFFDSSALVDAESDTLIYPGENGILYLMHLGTDYDPDKGTLSVHPDRVAKWHYMGKRSGDESYWLGMEDSAAIYKGYCFVCDNGGHMMCINLNTLRFVWVQDILDDSNGSPVLSIEDGHLYLYVSTSFHLGWRSDSTATIPIWKIDAEDGSVIWHRDYECYTEEGVSGGVQSTIALGKHGLSDRIFVTVSMTVNDTGGVCAAIDKATGEVLWEHEAAYAWSSPVCVYNEDGSGAVLYCSSTGKMYLIDGTSGEVRDTYDFGDVTLEASPAVYGNYAVVGTRDCEICGFRLT